MLHVERPQLFESSAARGRPLLLEAKNFIAMEAGVCAHLEGIDDALAGPLDECGARDPSISAATVLVSSSGTWPMVTEPVVAIAVNACSSAVSTGVGRSIWRPSGRRSIRDAPCSTGVALACSMVLLVIVMRSVVVLVMAFLLDGSCDPMPPD